MAEEVELQQTGGDSSLQGKYLELEVDGKIVNFKVKSVGDSMKDTTTGDIVMGQESIKERTKTMEQIKEEEQTEEIFSLVPDSTNAWLYIDDTFESKDTNKNGKIDCMEQCGDAATNKFIAIFVLCLQISAYIIMAVFLGNSRAQEIESRQQNCYGPNCEIEQPACMELSTGGLTSILLVGFLWADVVNVVALMTRSCRWAVASSLILCELITAIVCGFLVGVYSESNFDAIGGAVGILFVHDLDEKVFASMQVFRGQSYATLKKTIAITLWIVLSVVVAVVLACEYNDGTFFGQCKVGEYDCGDGDCIWEGFKCNGVKDCRTENDEGPEAGCNYALQDYCPDDKFQCVEDGSCIDLAKKCNGVIDCEEGSDEGRSQNCTEFIKAKKCGKDFNITSKSETDTYHKVWSGIFKCNNGQCIDAAFACDGQAGDCVDGSDEYPDFYKGAEYPFQRSCPYDQLIECDDEEVLCKLSGQCIAKTQLCDGTADCPDGQDETLCDYDCSGQVSNLKSFQCGGKIAFLNSTHYQLFEPDLTGITDPTAADLFVAYESKAKLLETDIFDNSTGACIAIEWRCDGVNDCDDGTDEVECSLFTCADDEYQCSDTGSCIPKSWLCDGVDDCNNKEDENKQICLQNGATISSSGCVADGYYYECSGFSDICLYEYNMCDGYQDCPYNDDEETSVCEALADASSNSDGSGSTGGTASCGDTLTGTGYQDDLHSYSFTMPSGMTEFKLSTCLTANQGETYAYMYTSDYSEYIYSNYDSTCGCSYRSVILGRSSGADNYNSYTITPGNTYTIDVYQYYTGAYAISIECGTTQYSEGGTCTGGNIGSIGSDFGTTPYYFNSYSTTSYGSNTGFGNTGSSTTSGTGFGSSGSSTTGFGSSGSSTTGFGGSSTTGTGTGTTSSGTTGSGTTSAAGTTDSGATNSTL